MGDFGEAFGQKRYPGGAPRFYLATHRAGARPGASTGPITALQTTVLTGAGGPAEASRISWRRARSFNLLSGNRSAAGVLLAPWLWPIELLTVAISASRIQRLGGASTALHDGRPARPDARLLVLALPVVVLYAAALEVIVVSLATVLPIRDPDIALGVGVLVGFGPLFAELAHRLLKVTRTPELRTLNRRRNELADLAGNPVLAMSSFVRSDRPGEGQRLLRNLQIEWSHSSTTVILNPANYALARYYLSQGAEYDGASWKRLRFPASSVGLDLAHVRTFPTA